MGKVIKSVANIAVSAGVGFVAGGPWGAVIAASAAAFNDFESSKLSNNGSTPSAQTVRSSKAPIRFILGRASTGGVLAWAQEDHTVSYKHEWLHLVYVLSEGEITGVDEIYLNEKLITEYPSEDYSYEVRINETEPDQFLMERCPDWKNTQIGRGISYLRLSLRYDPEVFTSIPTVRCVVRGLPLYDPRNGKTEYSDNPALMTLWYLRNRCNVPDDEIIMDAFSSAANVCDETVTNPDKSTSKRYTAAAVIGADEKRTDVLQKLETTMAGNLILSGGRWALQAGAYYGPATFTITEPMVVGPVSGSTEVDNADAVNVMTGTFIDPKSSWAQTDFPSVYMQDWITADGGEQSSSLTLDYVTDAYQAQRLANIALKKNRGAHSVSMTLNLSGYACRPGMIVKLDLPSLNMTTGEFVVNDWKYDPSQGISVTLQTTDSGIWDDAVGQAYNPLGYISVPTGGMDAPADLKWSVETYGDSVQGVLSWGAVAMADSYVVHVRTNAKNPADVYSVDVPATSTRVQLHGLEAGKYNMSVAAKGGSVTSGEATIGVEINVPPVPINVAVSTGNYEVSLTPLLGNDQTLGGGTWEYYCDQTGSIADSEVVGKATYLGKGLSYTQVGLEANTTYYYWVRGRNAYGVGDWYKLQAHTQNNANQIMQVISGKITNSDLNKDLQSNIGKISGDGNGSVNQRISNAKDDLNKSISAADSDAKAAQSTANQANSAAENAQSAANQAQTSANKAQSDADNAQKSADKANSDLKTATNSLNGDISDLTGKVNANKNSITSLTKTVNDKDSATNDRIDGLNSTVGNVSSNLAKEEQTRSDQNEALSERITTVGAQFGDGYNAIHDSSFQYGTTAYSTWYDALSMSTDSNGQPVLVTTNQHGAYLTTIASKIYATVGRPYTFTVDVYILQGSASQLQLQPDYFTAYSDANRSGFDAGTVVSIPEKKWVTLSFSGVIPENTSCVQPKIISNANEKNIVQLESRNWQFEFTGPATQAAISSEATARANADSAQTKRIDSVEVMTKGNTAAIQSEQSARTDGDNANAQQISALKSNVAQNSSAITEERQARADGDSANAQAINQLESTVTQNSAAITQESKTRTTNEQAMGHRLETVSASFGEGSNAVHDPGFSQGTIAYSSWSDILSIHQDSDGLTDLAIGYNGKGYLTVIGQRIPVPAGTSYTFNADVCISAGDTDTLVMEPNYYNSNDISKSRDSFNWNGTPQLCSLKEWVTLSISGTIPDGESFIEPMIISGSSPTKITELLTRNWFLELGGPNTNALITQEQKARASADQSLTDQVNTAQSTADNAQSTATSVQKTEARHNSAVNKRIDNLTTTVDGNTTAITKEEQARADGDAANTLEINQLKGIVDNNTSAITSEAQTRSSADNAISQRVDTLSASFGEGSNAIHDSGFVQGTTAFSSWGDSLSIEQDDTDGKPELVVNHKSGWLTVIGQRISAPAGTQFTFKADVCIVAGEEDTLQLEPNYYKAAMGGSRDNFDGSELVSCPLKTWKTLTITATVPSDECFIEPMIISGSSPSKITQLVTRNWYLELGGPNTNALITQEQQARATSEKVLTQQIQSAQSTASNAQSSITSLQNTEAQHNSATNSRIDSLNTKVGDNSTAIQNEQSARTSDVSALTKQYNSLSSKVDSNYSTIQQNYETKTDSKNAISKAQTTAQSYADGKVASAQQTLQTNIDSTNNRINSQYTLKVDSNGYIGGMALGNDGSTVQTIFRTDTFGIVPPDSKSKILPFVVSGNTVYINSAMIADASITSAKIGDIIKSDNYNAPGQTYGINLVPNSDFSNGAWLYSTLVDDAGDNSKYCQMTSSGMNWSTSDYFDVTGNFPYEYSILVKAAYDGEGDNDFVLNLHWFDENHNAISWANEVSSNTSNADQWVVITGNATAPSNAKYATVYIANRKQDHWLSFKSPRCDNIDLSPSDASIGYQGWMIDKSGKARFHDVTVIGDVTATTFSASSGTSGARTETTEQGTRVYDENGQIRIKLGNLA